MRVRRIHAASRRTSHSSPSYPATTLAAAVRAPSRRTCAAQRRAARTGASGKPTHVPSVRPRGRAHRPGSPPPSAGSGATGAGATGAVQARPSLRPSSRSPAPRGGVCAGTQGTHAGRWTRAASRAASVIVRTSLFHSSSARRRSTTKGICALASESSVARSNCDAYAASSGNGRVSRRSTREAGWVSTTGQPCIRTAHLVDRQLDQSLEARRVRREHRDRRCVIPAYVRDTLLDRTRLAHTHNQRVRCKDTGVGVQ